MKAYLLATGIWCIVDEMITCPPVGDAGFATQVMSDDMAQGNITWWLAVPICNQVRVTSTDTWANLLAAFGTVGISCIYGDFKSLVSFKISGGQNPTAKMEQFGMHLQRLTATNVAIPDNIVGMLILAALPAKWDHIAPIYPQGKTAIEQDSSTEVQQAIVANFDQTNSGDWQQAHRISAIQRKGEHPRYSKQGSTDKPSKAEGNHAGSSKKKTRCGGKKNKGKGRAALAECDDRNEIVSHGYTKFSFFIKSCTDYSWCCKDHWC